MRARVIMVVSLLAMAAACAADRGAPWARHTIDASSRGADGVRLADVNGDGLMDIATAWEEGGLVRAYLNPGKAKAKRPWPAVTVGTVRSGEDAVFVDLDCDGAIDVVSCCEGKVRTVWVHWAPRGQTRYLDSTAWRTQPIPATQGKQMWMFCLPMQVDGRHGVDLVLGAKGANAQIGWLEAPANPRDLAAWTWHPLYDARWIMSLLAHDVDGDGDVDIVASDRKGPKRGCLWLENPGRGSAQHQRWREHRIGTGGREIMFLTLVDLDGNGLTDVLGTVRRGDIVCHRRTVKSPPTWETMPIAMPPNAGTGKGIAVGDIDLDGKADIVFSCEHASNGKSGVLWMSPRNKPTNRTWTAHEISGPEGVKYDLVELIDLDADGDLDVLTCEERRGLGVVWYENPAR